MNPPQQQDGDNLSRRQRRSSLLRLNAAKEALQLTGNELLKGMSNSLQLNVARLSNNSSHLKMKRSAKKKSTALPTPSGSTVKRNAGRGPFSSQPASQRGGKAPTQGTSGTQKGNNLQGTGSTSIPRKGSLLPLARSAARGRGRPTALAAGRGGNIIGQVVRPAPKVTVPFGLGRSLLQPMRRSTSLDSNAWNSNSMMTPLTPGRSMMSKSPMSMRRYGSSTDLREKGKSIPIPSAKDTKSLSNMVAYVHRFLDDYRYPKLPKTPQDMKLISSNIYFDMVRFVAENMLGPAFFQKGKDPKEDLSAKIVELAQLLKYPGTINKSHLKSANAQHAWPSCITLLYWLCCRVRAALERREENPMVDLEREEGPNQIGLPSYMNLFLFSMGHVSTLPEEEKDAVWTEKLREELEEFRENVSETMSEVNSSVEELQAQKMEKLAQLDALKATLDPSKDVLDAVAKTKNKIDNLRKKLAETQGRIAIYKETNSIRLKRETLQMEIQGRKMEIQALKTQISSQPLDKERAKIVAAETEEFKKQRECLHLILLKLETDKKRKQQIVKNLEDRFRQTIAKFNVVETFNANLSNLKVDGLSVPANPLTAEELCGWLDKVESIHEKTERASRTLMEAVKQDQAQQVELDRKAVQTLTTWAEKEAFSKSDLKAATELLNEEEAEFESRRRGLNTELSQVCQKVEQKELVLHEAKNSLKLKSEVLKETNLKKEKFEDISAVWNKGVCDWSDALLYLKEKAIDIMKGKVDRILNDFREYLRVKYDDDETELSQQMEKFEADVSKLDVESLLSLSNFSLNTQQLPSTSGLGTAAPSQTENNLPISSPHLSATTNLE